MVEVNHHHHTIPTSSHQPKRLNLPHQKSSRRTGPKPQRHPARGDLSVGQKANFFQSSFRFAPDFASSSQEPSKKSARLRSHALGSPSLLARQNQRSHQLSSPLSSSLTHIGTLQAEGLEGGMTGLAFRPATARATRSSTPHTEAQRPNLASHMGRRGEK